MKSEGFRKVMDSPDLTVGEKAYIKDFQFRLGGSFTIALFEAISHADERNLSRLEKGFPDEVQGFLAWTRGDLHERASKIADGPVGYIENAEDQNGHS